MNKILNNVIGKQLKVARQTKGWSLDLASKSTGVSKAMLGQIERGESSPTVARLWDIANGFELPLSYFLGNINNKLNNSRNLKPDGERIEIVDSGIVISTLFPFDPMTNIEIFRLCLAPEHQHISLAHNDGVIEHLIVIDGAMEYLTDNKWQGLQAGEVAKFNADKNHGYRNVTDSPVTFHNIIFYPA